MPSIISVFTRATLHALREKNMLPLTEIIEGIKLRKQQDKTTPTFFKIAKFDAANNKDLHFYTLKVVPLPEGYSRQNKG